MLHFTKYAEQKFDILNKHGVYFRKEQILDCVNLPDKTAKKGKYIIYQKENIKTVCQKQDELMKIITFYPTKYEN
jgi:hypothetical protein